MAPINTPLSIDSIVSVAPEQLSCALGDESAILNLKNTVYYGLDQPADARRAGRG